MKKNIIIVFTIILFVLCFADISKSDSKVQSFSGRVINVSGEYIELKKGYKEILLQISDNSVFIAKDGHEADGKIVEICQYVKAEYSVEDSKNMLKKYIINKESDCIK